MTGADDRIPVHVLTGFLGSGKTTLLQALLGGPALADTAVIINELGAIALDHLLVRDVAEGAVVLRNGCICCAIRTDLVSTLRELQAKRAAGSVPPFARVVLETTGLADPLPVVATLTADPVLRHQFRPGLVITTVDAVNGLATLDAQPESEKQAAIADRLVLTKTDLATDPAAQARLRALRRRLAAINPAAPLIEAGGGAAGSTLPPPKRGRVGEGASAPTSASAPASGQGAACLQGSAVAEAGATAPSPTLPRAEGGRIPPTFGLGAYARGAAAVAAAILRGGLQDETGRQAEVAHWLAAAGNGHGHTAHGDGVRSFCLSFAEPLDWTAFGIWLTMVLHRHGDRILRVKGLLNVEGLAAPVVIHGVQQIVHPPVHLERWPDADSSSRLVFIVRGLDPALVERSLRVFLKLGEPIPAAARSPRSRPSSPA